MLLHSRSSPFLLLALAMALVLPAALVVTFPVTVGELRAKFETGGPAFGRKPEPSYSQSINENKVTAMVAGHEAVNIENMDVPQLKELYRCLCLKWMKLAQSESASAVGDVGPIGLIKLRQDEVKDKLAKLKGSPKANEITTKISTKVTEIVTGGGIVTSPTKC